MEASEQSRFAPKKTVNAAKNFAATILAIETGAVSSSCSVRILRSSEKSFIVRTGSATMRMNSSTVK